MATSISLPAERRRSLHGLRLVGVVVGTIVLLGLTLGVLSRSSALHVRRIDVRGASHLSEAAVIRLSGLSDRTNAVWLHAGDAIRRLESDPWIERARVDRELPFGLRITIVERTPVAVSDQRGRRLLIAADGTALGPAAPDRGSSLAEIVVPPRPALTGPAPGIDGAARVMGSLPDRIRRDVRRVVVGTDGTIRLVLQEGPVVDYGWPEDMAGKARVLTRVMAWAQGQGERLRSVNLVAPAAAAVTLGG